jgi:hypothetical protein
MSHRIREAMRVTGVTPMGGSGEIVEVDETYIGRLDGQPKRPRASQSSKNTVLTLVQRGGGARSFHIEGATIAQVAPIIRANIARETQLMSDESNIYPEVGADFAGHDTVKHSDKEYVRYFNEVTGELRPDGKPVVVTHTIATNTVEGFYSIFKRGMKGIYQHCSEKHLHRYLAEFDFRYSNRVRFGIDDVERTERAVKGIVGKRLTYRTARH